MTPVRRYLRYLVAGAWLVSAGGAEAETLTHQLAKSAFETLQAESDRFTEVPVGQEAGTSTFFAVPLGEEPVTVGTSHRYDAIRFRTPTNNTVDLVWTFGIPREWSHWYILKADGVSGAGFSDWIESPERYRDVPWPDDAYVVLQELSHQALNPDTEYLIWFHTTNEIDGTLHGAMNFLPAPEDGWSMDSMEAALGLQVADWRTRAAALNSRGAQVLLDTNLFSETDAEAQLDNYFFTRRQSKDTATDLSITMQTSIPASSSKPSLQDVVAAHGEPDLVVPAIQTRSEPDQEFEAGREVWYYDVFGFETRTDDVEKRVSNVVAQPHDYSNSHSKHGGLTFDEIPNSRTLVFYNEQDEVARIGFLGTGPYVAYSGTIEPGVYRQFYPTGEVREELDYRGDRNWEQRLLSNTGLLFRRFHLTNHLYNGVAEDYHETGSTRATYPYLDGRPHGTMTWFATSGEITRELVFDQGEPVPIEEPADAAADE